MVILLFLIASTVTSTFVVSALMLSSRISREETHGEVYQEEKTPLLVDMPR